MRNCPDCQAFVPHWHEEELAKVYAWKRPRRIFLQDMGDLFHPEVSDEKLFAVVQAVVDNPHHTFLMLTKCPERMRNFFEYWREMYARPLPSNLWLGTTATTEAELLENGRHLIQIDGAAILWVSLEPLREGLSLKPFFVEVYPDGPRWEPRIDWVVLGGETGPGAAPMEPRWVENIRDECRAAGVPFFFKSWGDWSPEVPFDNRIKNRIELQSGTWMVKEKREDLDGETVRQIPEKQVRTALF